MQAIFIGDYSVQNPYMEDFAHGKFVPRHKIASVESYGKNEK
mgnify:FL=1